ncbi:hypothetical protein [Pseudomarimonas arenosa]|uniref:Uncharacterized protein n=1 Tax=Pseudomarimonas arenosa TaxID=2774145 RepID=A0AAW3ZLV5_9GAMM|nr:hypothetical protein [Pseudomarimonas arenosa]MBD8525401.1 hypothetical protein [Pseudomarimonas arenosa]
MKAKSPLTARSAALGLLLFAVAAPSFAACDGPAWLKLEIVASEIAGNPIGEWIEVDANGCVLSHYPYWQRQSGVYQRQLDAKELDQLRGIVSQNQLLQFDTSREREALQQADRDLAKRSGEYSWFSMEGANLYRLQVVEDERSNLIEWATPAGELKLRQVALQQKGLRPEGMQGLQRLVESIRSLRSIAADPRKQKIAEVTP